MKNKNLARQYFNQKEFSPLEIVLIIIAAMSAFAAIFVDNGGPIGILTFFLSIAVLIFYRSKRVKDEEIDQMLQKFIEDKKIEITDNTIACYDLKNSKIKKRKDGKLCSQNYYVTNVVFKESGEIVFNINILDLIALTVQKMTYTTKDNSEISLIEEEINDKAGHVKAAYLKIGNSDNVIPVSLNDYKISQLVEVLCKDNEKN